MAFHLDHVVLWVEDPRRSVAFYTDVVGLLPVRAEEHADGKAPFPSIRISPVTILDLVPLAGIGPTREFTGEVKETGAGKPLNHICLAMDQDEHAALAKRLAAAGVATHRVGEKNYGAQGHARQWFYFQDPDGNMIEARHYES